MTDHTTLQTSRRSDQLGATLQDDGSCTFRVWAPKHERVTVRLHDSPGRRIALARDKCGYHVAAVDDIQPNSRYTYVLSDELERPDPASRAQPDGVHGASAIVDTRYNWTDHDFAHPPLDEQVIYELHVGVFTEQGTFHAVIERLDDLIDLGVTTLQIMPVAQFPGSRNWGYDGVGLFAAQNSYGGLVGLQQLVNACHVRGLSVFLDVVYNHLGPEGNYLRDFGPYFTHQYSTPWGDALNFDGPESDHVRRFFIDNALFWIEDCHIDGLRLDAVHAIVDNAPLPFIEELATTVHHRAVELGRRVHVIAESAANDARLLRPARAGGFGMDAQWNDDFHHVVHVLLTGESDGYYVSYRPDEHLPKLFSDGYAYTGEYSPFHRRRHGRPSRDIPYDRFIVFTQNHDQVGNRMLGERLSTLAGADAARFAASIVLLSPFVPMLFMGEEYAEAAPFLYFVDHSDLDLIDAVRRGRQAEFESFAWKGAPPDPADQETFNRSRLDWSLRDEPTHAPLLALYRDLIQLRRTHPAMAAPDRERTSVRFDDDTMTLERWNNEGARIAAVLNLTARRLDCNADLTPGRWRRLLDTADERYGGPGAATIDPLASPGATLTLQPYAVVVYEQGV